jgi:hypothetical protein
VHHTRLHCGQRPGRGDRVRQALEPVAADDAHVGDAALFGLLRAWHETHRDRNVTVRQFRSFAARYSGQDLSHFFAVWLDREGKPHGW